MTTKNICVFGDSIAYGAWSRDRGWADRLRAALQRRTLDFNFQEYYFLHNESIPGNTTDDVLGRFSAECEARAPHVVVFAVGINDASCRDNSHMSLAPSEVEERVLPGKFKKNVHMLIDKAKHHTHTVVWIGLTRVDESRAAPLENTYFFNEQIAAYDAALKKICEESGVPYL